ncbi:TetR/AcrR family transcriptional regulator [Streptomyces sp. SBT349]|uniref:TetR/AcrR family transcriptional regulator n=1 Tax=Streptomyces sp. SBT349 TaxID=1580539 RepID=UPI00069E6DC5|nr:TetR/AcrR family transcriptional regulator [Streptomyces sp. SBT349]
MSAATDDPSPTRARTLRAAAEVLATDGPGGLSVRRIAAAAGTSTMSIYHHFGGKAGLLDALYVEGFAALRTAQTPPRGEDPEEDIAQMCLAYRRVALDNPALYQLMFARPDPEFAPAEESRLIARANYRQFVDAVRRWARQAPLTTDPASAAHVLWAAGHGLVMLELVGNAPAGDRAARYGTAVRTILRGLRGPGGEQTQ